MIYYYWECGEGWMVWGSMMRKGLARGWTRTPYIQPNLLLWRWQVGLYGVESFFENCRCHYSLS
jgi:hypothetical protein